MDIIEFDSVFKYIMDMEIVYPVVEGRVTMLNYKKPEPIPTIDTTELSPGSASHLTISMSLIIFTTISLFNYVY